MTHQHFETVPLPGNAQVAIAPFVLFKLGGRGDIIEQYWYPCTALPERALFIGRSRDQETTRIRPQRIRFLERALKPGLEGLLLCLAHRVAPTLFALPWTWVSPRPKVLISDSHGGRVWGKRAKEREERGGRVLPKTSETPQLQTN